MDEEEIVTEKLQFNVPLIKESDMPEDQRNEICEMVVSTFEKNQDEYDRAVLQIRQTLDEKYGKHWHCILGEAYGYDLTYVPKTFLQVYVAGFLGVTIWKS
ncbi:hypothetical protein O3M35_010415 [Rhynocoris fuscipes]|uniref:Dynein light chain n=1 Tax=Rhynocoris fuscipes TaxID=488301 RepID=A0AAW1D2G3_9HEMI